NDPLLKGLASFFASRLPAQIFDVERVDGVEFGLAIAAAKRDRLDRLAASGTGFGVPPCRKRRVRIRFVLGQRGGLFASVSGTAADLKPTLVMVRLAAVGAGDHPIRSLQPSLANRT